MRLSSPAGAALASQNVNTGVVLVNAGTLALAKSGVFGSGGGVAITTATLVIGDNIGTAATVRLDADEQISNATALTINGGGLFNLQGFSETLGTVNIVSTAAGAGGASPAASGTLYTGAINMMGGTLGLSSGTVFLGGNVTAASNLDYAGRLERQPQSGHCGAHLHGHPRPRHRAERPERHRRHCRQRHRHHQGGDRGDEPGRPEHLHRQHDREPGYVDAHHDGGAGATSTGELSPNSAVILGGTLIGPVNPTLDVSSGAKTLGSLTGGALVAPYVAGVVNIGSQTLTIGTDETSPAAFTGAIIGTGGLTKVGLGTLTLNNTAFSNSWTGPTTVNAGYLSVTGAHALPLTTPVTVNSGGTLFIAGVAQMLQSLQVNAGGTLNGTVGPLTINIDDSSSTIDGFLHGSFALNKAGLGTVSITGNQNTFTGALNVNQGKLTLSGAGVIPTTAALTINPGGTFRLDNSVTNVTDRLAATMPVTMQGGTFQIDGLTTAASAEQLGALTLNQGVSTINLVNGAGAGSSVQLTFNGAITRTAGTLNVTSSGLGTLGTAGAAPRLQFLGQGFRHARLRLSQRHQLRDL